MAGSLIGGLLEGYNESRDRKLKRQEEEEIKKLKLKLYKNQLEEQHTQKEKAQELFSMLQGSSATSPVPQGVAAPETLQPKIGGLTPDIGAIVGQPEMEAPARPAQPGIRLLDLLTTPKGQQLALQSGMFTGKDVAALSKKTEPFGGMDLPGFELKDITVDEEGERKLKFARSYLDTPQKPETLKLYEDEKGISPPPGTTLRQLNNYKMREDKLQTSEAARIALSNVGMESIERIKEIMFPDGKLDKKVLFQMAAPGGGIGAGREVKQLAYPAIAGQILLISGVAVRPEEREALSAAFIPSPLDMTREGLAERKLNNFNELLKGNVDAVLPSLPPSLRSRIVERRAKDEAVPTGLPSGAKQIGTSGGKPVWQAPNGERYIVD